MRIICARRTRDHHLWVLFIMDIRCHPLLGKPSATACAPAWWQRSSRAERTSCPRPTDHSHRLACRLLPRFAGTLRSFFDVDLGWKFLIQDVATVFPHQVDHETCPFRQKHRDWLGLRGSVDFQLGVCLHLDLDSGSPFINLRQDKSTTNNCSNQCFCLLLQDDVRRTITRSRRCRPCNCPSIENLATTSGSTPSPVTTSLAPAEGKP